VGGDMSHILVGIVLLAFGRRLFWLFVGGVGFVAGFEMARQYLALQPQGVILGVGLLCGLIGILLAIFFQRLAVGLGGFAAGGTIAQYLAVVLGLETAPMLGIYLVGGIIGAVLLYVAFDWALIFLSSVAGASLIVQSIQWVPLYEALLYGVLIVAGATFQAVWMNQLASKERHRET